jgi:hypothetical protein
MLRGRNLDDPRSENVRHYRYVIVQVSRARNLNDNSLDTYMTYDEAMTAMNVKENSSLKHQNITNDGHAHYVGLRDATRRQTTLWYTKLDNISYTVVHIT